jgi:hypothetical protein
MKRIRGYRHTTSLARAEQRVDRLFQRMARADAPIWSGSVGRDDAQLRHVRALAQAAADEAGRGELLDAALERLSGAYASRLGEMGYWTALVGIPVPFTSAERAASQRVLQDLITAAVVEDLLEVEAVARLRADGETLLGSADEPERAAPLDPFHHPLTPTGRRVARLFAAWMAADLFAAVALWLEGGRHVAVLLVTLAMASVLLVVAWWASERLHGTR